MAGSSVILSYDDVRFSVFPVRSGCHRSPRSGQSMTSANETSTFGVQSGYLLIEVLLVVLLVAIADWIVLSMQWLPVRMPAGLLLIGFLPGYSLSTVLFPTRRFRTRYGALEQFAPGISTSERFWLSIGLSLAIDPIIGLGLWTLDPQGFDAQILVGVFSTFILVATLYGGIKRRRIDPSDRFRLRIDVWIAQQLRQPPVGGTLGRVLNVAVICSLVLTVGTLGYALTVPQTAESFTTVELLTESTDGLELVGNSSDIDEGEPVTIQITNHEQRHHTYTVVVVTERARYDGTEVIEERARLNAAVPAGERRRLSYELSAPGSAGDRVRFLVYRGEPPGSPTGDNAYRSVHIWFDDDSASVGADSR